MQTSLQGIAKKAKTDTKHKFGNLYSLLNEENLSWCFKEMNRKASPGIDGIDYAAYEEDLETNVKRLVESLKSKTYKAKLIRRKHIPKGDGQRPLGIPVVSDKLLQTTCSRILESIFEQDFMDFSHGYRRGHGPQKAVLDIRRQLQFGNYNWVIDADIKGFFDNIDHDWMMRMLEERIDDKSFLRLIRKWLKAGIFEENGKVTLPVTGTPQGSSISAVLANIYLHFVLDLWFEKKIKPRCCGNVTIIRFADDFICCFQYANDVQNCLDFLKARLRKFNLELSESKTRLIRFTRSTTFKSEPFNFLGFEFRREIARSGKPVVRVKTMAKKYRKAIQSVRDWIKHSRSIRIKELMSTYKQKLQGHWNYYGVRGNYSMIHKFYWNANKIVFKWLNRRSQRKSFNWEEFNAILRYYKIPSPRIIAS
jgi:group II intron reverse transcriptase/maturase